MGEPIDHSDGRAYIEDGYIVIRVAISALDTVVDGAWALNGLPLRYRVTEPATFAKELCNSLNDEDEQGTTRIHRAFDSAISHAIDQGAEGIEEHEDQNA